MEELIAKLGIDWKLLIAQIINFLILLAILIKFLYKPLLGMMENRRKGIEESLAKAKKIEENLKKTDIQKDEILAQARKEAQTILQEAKEQADNKGKEMIDQAKREVNQIVIKAKEEIASQKQTAMAEVKNEVADLVMSAVRKIMGKNLDDKVDEKFIKQTLGEIK